MCTGTLVLIWTMLLGKIPQRRKIEKKKKKKSTTQEGEGKATVDQTVSAVGNKEVEEKQSEVKSSQVRTFANGLVIEELQLGCFFAFRRVKEKSRW